MKRKKIKVFSYSVTGAVDFRRLFPHSYEQTKQEFREEGITLPDIDITDKSEWRVLLSESVIIKVFTNIGTIIYRFKRGFMSDMASIPKVLRGVVMDNDDLDLVICCGLVHDANFQHRFFGSNRRGFRMANRLMKQMIQSGNSTRFRAFLIWFGVASPVGWKIYKKYRFGKNYSECFVEREIV